MPAALRTATGCEVLRASKPQSIDGLEPRIRERKRYVGIPRFLTVPPSCLWHEVYAQSRAPPRIARIALQFVHRYVAVQHGNLDRKTRCLATGGVLWICRCAWTTLVRRPQLHRAYIGEQLI